MSHLPWERAFRLNGFPVLIGLGVAYFLATSSMALIPVMKEMNRKTAAPPLETAQV